MKRLILFAHFDPDQQVRPFVEHHLKALKELGGTLWFISNSPLPPALEGRLSSLADRVIQRENIGYDFCMWQEALRMADLSEWDELVLTNSSIAGPFRPLGGLFDRMAGSPCDFWGLTESLWPFPHLQSYFLVFRRAVLDAAAFTRFWDSVLPYRDKRGTIAAYEIGLTIFLRDQGFVGIPAFPLQDLPQSFLGDLALGRPPRFGTRKGRIPAIYYPDLLIRAGMPYVKLEVFRRNPERLRLRPIVALVRDTGFPVDLLG